MIISLEDSFRQYKEKLGIKEQVIRRTEQYIDKAKIVVMQRINYFQYKSKNTTGYIFFKEGSCAHNKK